MQRGEKLQNICLAAMTSGVRKGFILLRKANNESLHCLSQAQKEYLHWHFKKQQERKTNILNVDGNAGELT
jgi:hypothetical protein